MTNLIKAALFDVESNAVINPRWEFGYDANAQLALVRDPKRRATSFTYQTVEIIGWIFRIVLPYSSYKTQCLCV